MDKIITIFKSFSKIPGAIKEYGVQNIVITLILCVILGLVFYAFLRPDVVVQRFEQAQDKRTAVEYKKRMKIDSQIRETLLEFKSNMYADRVFVFETHNGGSNLNGLKFIYVDMTYDEYSDGLLPVANEYLNIRTSTNQWIGFVCEQGSWYGDIDEVKDIDLSFYYRLKKAGVKRIGIIVMHGKDRPSGFLGFCYYDNESENHVVKDKTKVNRELNKYGSIIGTKLCSIE